MRVSEKWLREYVNPNVGTQQLADTLTMAGLEVDAIEPAAPKFSGIVYAKVVEVTSHPDAKKLHVCNVDDGSGKLAQVICGVSNVCENLIVAFAKVGAELPNNFKIEAKKLRGVESFGMLCSAAELGLAETSDGILELPADSPLGEEIYSNLGLDDSVIDIDLTPNRSDCLSMYGVAREVSALLDSVLELPQDVKVENTIGSTFPISISAQEQCPRYVGRIIEGVKTNLTSPMWMQERLRRAGIRSINAIIDITNYVMIEMGQPMHAFDVNKLHKGIEVRMAHPAESLVLLDGQEINLTSDELVIADQNSAVALAGVMGGNSSAVDDHTKDIFLESAFFTPEAILGKARRYGLHTDSSHRFERGVDPGLCIHAMERATQLIIEVAGGNAGPAICEENISALPKPEKINILQEKVEALLGVDVSTQQIEDIMQRLQCSVDTKGTSLTIIPPSHRFDLKIDVDIIEEVARVIGYENMPASVKAISVNPCGLQKNVLQEMKSYLSHAGFHEIISFSFVDQTTENCMREVSSSKVLANPISQELAVMRNSLWPGLLKTAQYNLHRQQSRIRIFEYGLRFLNEKNNLQQLPAIAGLLAGPVLPEHWDSVAAEVDFYDLKGEVIRLLEIAGLTENEIIIKTVSDNALHPGQAASVLINEEVIGRFGKLHPRIQSELDLDISIYLFEINLTQLLNCDRNEVFTPLSKYPSIRRDITLIVDKDITSEEIRSNIEQMEIDCLQKVIIFSVYTGEGISELKKSISLGLILQEFSRTLTDKEIEKTISTIISQLKNKVGAEIRS